METYVVEEADSPFVDKVGPCGSNEAKMPLSVLQGMYKDKPLRKQTQKNFEESTKMEKNYSQRRKRQRKMNKTAERTSWAERTEHEGKLNAPVNHMVNVASHWACTCQKTADLRH